MKVLVSLLVFFYLGCRVSAFKVPLLSGSSRLFKQSFKLSAEEDSSNSLVGSDPLQNEPPRTKGFGKAKQKEPKPEIEKDIGSITYDNQAKKGVPEYNIFLRPSNGTETEWIPVGSMTIPRDVSIAKAVYEVEEELLKGTFKIYPQMKKFYEEKKQKRLGDYDREAVFEYGYCLKAFPDEAIVLIQKEKPKQNFLTDW